MCQLDEDNNEAESGDHEAPAAAFDAGSFATHELKLSGARQRIMDQVDTLWQKANRSPLFHKSRRHIQFVSTRTLQSIVSKLTRRLLREQTKTMRALGLRHDSKPKVQWTPSTTRTFNLALGYMLSMLVQEAVCHAVDASGHTTSPDSKGRVVLNRDAMTLGFRRLRNDSLMLPRTSRTQ